MNSTMKIYIEQGLKSAAGDVTLFTVTNRHGASVVLSTLGAGIVAVNVPDRKGNLGNVVLGYATPADYFRDGPCAGKTIGRVANRIGNAGFVLGGKEYRLPANDGKNSLHGGPDGFMNRIWNAEVLPDGVKFSYHSPDGECGFPGDADVTVTYTWNDACELCITFGATASGLTVMNLTNHAYFNLEGEDSSGVGAHTLKLWSCRFLETDGGFIPTGRLIRATGPMDFSHGAPLEPCFSSGLETLRHNRGLNHYYVFDDDRISDSAITGEEGCMQNNRVIRSAATLYASRSGRQLDVSTSYPGIMVYTGGWLSDSPADRQGRPHADHQAVALECQGYPDAPNHPDFPSVTLAEGEVYCHTIVYKFHCPDVAQNGENY